MSDHIQFSQIEFSAVTENGFQDVSIMTKGEAQGHGMLVDDKTIEQFMKLSIGKTIPAYLTHAGAIDSSGRPADRLGKEIGMFSGFYRDGDKVRAKNFQFLDSFKQSEPKVYGTLRELAKSFSDKLGISPVLRTAKAWILKDGSEVESDGKSVPANLGQDLPVMRLGSLLSCDFVQKPATNLGLFEEGTAKTAPVDEKPNSHTMTAETILLSKHTEEVTSLSAAHKEAVTALETKHKDAITALQAKIDEFVAKQAKHSDEITQLNSALVAKAKEADEAAKFDMRKAGAPALQVALDQNLGGHMPAPKDTDSERWEQYSALCEATKDHLGNVVSHKETAVAKQFKEKYLSKRR